MRYDDLCAAVTKCFDFDLPTMVAFLKLRHGRAQEFKSIPIEVEIRGEIATRLIDPPEKKTFYDELRFTLMGFAKPDAPWADLTDQIIAAYYNACRREDPTPPKLKEPYVGEDSGG